MATAKPFKTSNYASFKISKVEDYIKNIDRDLQQMFTYINTFPPLYTQGTEPTIGTDAVAFWKDSDDGKYYLIKDIAGTQKKVELT